LAALEENGCHVSGITGASSGAWIAALYAYGISPQEMMAEAPKLSRRELDPDWAGLFRWIAKRRRSHVLGFLKGERLMQFVRHFTGNAKMTAAKIPLMMTAVDLTTGCEFVFTSSADLISPEDFTDTKVISDITIAEAVRASYSIPLLFQPFRYGNHLLVDGGVLDNCPLHLLEYMKTDYKIAVDPLYVYATKTMKIPTMGTLFSRVVNVMLSGQSRKHLKTMDLVLCPDVGNVGVLSFDKIQHCMQCGYAYASSRMDELKPLFT